MPKKIKGKNGGTLINSLPGESGNPNGRPKTPKTIKETIKALENVDDHFLIPVSSCKEIVEKNGRRFYKVEGTNGQKLIMAQMQRAFKGDSRALDWLTKMGYAGGYEPAKTKTEHSGSLTLNPEEIKEKTDKALEATTEKYKDGLEVVSYFLEQLNKN